MKPPKTKGKQNKRQDAAPTSSPKDIEESTSVKAESEDSVSTESTASDQMSTSSLTKKTIKGLWSAEEDKMLLSLIEVYGPSRWVEISHQLKTRTAKQCRERYHQNLRPNLNKSPISIEEGDAIKGLVAKHGFRWTLIAKLLNTNRSDNSIKNWWKTNVKKKQRNVFRDSNPSGTMAKDFDMMAGPEINPHLLHGGSPQFLKNHHPHDRDPSFSCESNSPKSDCSSPIDHISNRRNYVSPIDQYGQRLQLHSHPHFVHMLPMGPNFIQRPLLPQDMHNNHRGIAVQPYIPYPQYAPATHMSANMFPILVHNANVQVETVSNDNTHNNHNDNTTNINDGVSNTIHTQSINHGSDASTEIQHHMYASLPPPIGTYMGPIIPHSHLMPPQTLSQGAGTIPAKIEETQPAQPIMQHPNLPVQQTQPQQLIRIPHGTGTETKDSKFVVPSSPMANTSVQHMPMSNIPNSPAIQQNFSEKTEASTGVDTSHHVTEPPSNKLPSFEELTQKMKLNNSSNNNPNLK